MVSSRLYTDECSLIMMNFFNWLLFYILLLGEIVNAGDVDFNECRGIPCELTLPIECSGQQEELRGKILSPGFPLKITNESQFGIYTLLITADCPFTIDLALNRPDFLIGLPENTFTVGVGSTVNTDIVGSRLKGTEKFPENQDILDYNKLGSSSIWIQIDVSKGFFWFDISYNVTDVKEVFQDPCDQDDSYGVNWKTYKNETMEKDCSVGVPGALGKAYWKCSCTNNLCKFDTNQPNFTRCQSPGLQDITESINKNDTNVTEIWKEIERLTANNHYYGQEIIKILINAVEALLTRMQREIDAKENPDFIYFLGVQISSSELATKSMDHLVSNEGQWEQLIEQGKGDNEFLDLLDVSNDIAFRLSNVSKQAEVPLICEYSFSNVTISSSYWNGSQRNISVCSKNETFQLASLRFPNRKDNDGMENLTSYIELPKDIGKTPFKTSGVFIAASDLIQLLLPGSDNIERLDSKEVNSPLIIYTLYNPEANSFYEEAQLPNDSYVQLVFKHEVNAQYPSVRTLRRDRDYEGEESTVMDSSICSYLAPNEDTDNGSWIWENKGCRVISMNSTHTVCKCTHLTGFAGLMDFHNFVGRSVALDATSMTCSILSLIGLASTFCILIIFRNLKLKRTFLTQNLCITLMISYFLILLTLDKRFLRLNEVTCAAMGILLHYMLLACFMWMLIEGFQLYRIVVKVLGTKKHTIQYTIVAYTVPFCIVGITILTAESNPTKEFVRGNSTVTLTGIMQAYSGEETCWLVGPWVWAFNGPVAVIIVANCRFLVSAICASCKSNRNLKRNPYNMIGGVFILTFLLGLTWVFGFLLFSDLIVFPFIFTIANGLQGVVIFINRCILNKKIRNEIIKNMKCFMGDNKKKNVVTKKEHTGQSSLPHIFSNLFERNHSQKSSTDSTAEIIPRITRQSFKNSSFNT